MLRMLRQCTNVHVYDMELSVGAELMLNTLHTQHSCNPFPGMQLLPPFPSQFQSTHYHNS